jgi:hypothetical protein
LPLTSSCAGGEAEGLCGIGGADGTAAAAARAVGYLAQHPLFDQIPQLAHDIREPEYCALGEGVLHSVNAWFGPAGTVSLPASDCSRVRL